MWIHLTELHLCFVEQALTLSLRNLRRASLERIEAYADKGNFISSQRERSFLRNFFLIWEFISQTYNFDFRKQFANTLFVGSEKWYLVVHRGPWWKRKWPHIITTEKLSDRLRMMCDFITQSSTLPLLEQFSNTVLVDYAKVYLGAPWGLGWEGIILTW